jgi:hypothetical protein
MDAKPPFAVFFPYFPKPTCDLTPHASLRAPIFRLLLAQIAVFANIPGRVSGSRRLSSLA